VTLSPKLLRAALEEYIRMGPESKRPAAERLAARESSVPEPDRTAALAEAKRAVGIAELLAREYQEGTRTQKEIIAELRRQFPWLDKEGWFKGDLAAQLGAFGYYLVIM
jgi:hypothetical protein